MSRAASADKQCSHGAEPATSGRASHRLDPPKRRLRIHGDDPPRLTFASITVSSAPLVLHEADDRLLNVFRALIHETNHRLLAAPYRSVATTIFRTTTGADRDYFLWFASAVRWSRRSRIYVPWDSPGRHHDQDRYRDQEPLQPFHTYPLTSPHSLKFPNYRGNSARAGDAVSPVPEEDTKRRSAKDGGRDRFN